jgi:glycolate oxidase FAD binding subunit
VICPEPSALQELVRELHQQARPWLPAGSGSRLCWGPPVQPAAGESEALVISTSRLNRLVEHRAGDFTVTVDAGLPLQQLQAELAEARQWLAIDWPWGSGPLGEASGTVGGLVARGLSGGLRQRYLGIRDQLIGVSLIRADGTPAKAGGQVVKNVAGYDLMRLLAGSWGSLGLITSLTLRTYPLPPQRAGLWMRGSVTELERMRQICLAAPLLPQRLDWRLQPEEASGDAGLLLALVSVSRPAIDAQLEQHQRHAAELGLSVDPLNGEALQALEAEARGASSHNHLAGEQRWLLQLGVLPAQVQQLLRDGACQGLQGTLAAGAGLGLAWAAAESLPAHRVERLRRRCRDLGGDLTVLDQPQPHALLAWDDAPARAVIEAIKREFDPLQQLARGRLPGVAPR